MSQVMPLSPVPQTLRTSCPTETEAVGAALAQMFLTDASLPPFVALYGDLGVGKTAFVRGFASVYAPGRQVRSPTFALVNEYRTPGRVPLFHFDMYRITGEDDLYSMGYDDYLDRGICLCEWCENIPEALPDRRVKVVVTKCPEAVGDRLITLCIKEDAIC